MLRQELFDDARPNLTQMCTSVNPYTDSFPCTPGQTSRNRLF